jgi:3-hydroxyacyl-CoA dehydrogenase
MKSSINILGAGTMGSQLIALFSVLGFTVNYWNKSYSEPLIKRIKTQVKFFEKNFQKQENGAINFIQNLDQMSGDITIEALVENVNVKKDVIAKLNFTPSEFPFFTNSSSFLPTEIHPEIQSLHFFNPIYSIRLVETTCSDIDQHNKFNIIFSELRNLNFSIAEVKNNRGFVGNYMLFREISNLLYLIEKYHYSIKTIEAVQSSLGQPHSLISIIDHVGVDVTKAILDNLHEEDSSVFVPNILDIAIKKGILGRKNKTTIMSLLN